MPLNPDSPLARLMATLPRAGKVEWIGLRPARDEAMIATGTVEAIAALAQRPDLTPALLRRNVVVSGIPLVALKQRRFRIGTAVFEGTEECDPCSRMEDALGPGGYNAMRGHGGLCARIVEGGTFGLGDALEAL